MNILSLCGKVLIPEGNSEGLLYACEKKYSISFLSKTSNPGIKELAVRLP